MDKRTRVAKKGPSRTVVMDTPPKMTAIMDRVSAQSNESNLVPAELGITRMPTGPDEEEVSSDKTSLFIRRQTGKEAKRADRPSPSATRLQPANAASNLATRMVHAEGNSGRMNPQAFETEKVLPGYGGPPLPPPGRNKKNKRANTESVRRMERLLKPVILAAVLAVSAVVVLSQRSESVADTAGGTQSAIPKEGRSESGQSGKLVDKEQAQGDVHLKTSQVASTDSESGKAKAPVIKEEQEAPRSYAGKGNATSESKAASLLISGHRREALNHYRRLAALPNASSGVKAMRIVLEQKVESP